MSTITKDEEERLFKIRMGVRKSNAHIAKTRRLEREYKEFRVSYLKRAEEAMAREHTKEELIELIKEWKAFERRQKTDWQEEIDWEKAKNDYLKNNFTEEERKMFDEYYALEKKITLNWRNVSQELEDEILSFVEKMLLIPGSIERCSSYLMRKLQEVWMLEEDSLFSPIPLNEYVAKLQQRKSSQ